MTSARVRVPGSDVARLGSGEVAVRDDGDERQVVMQRQRRLHRLALDHGGGDEPAEHTGRRVLGMPVVGGGDGKGVLGAGRRGRGGGEGRRGAQSTRHRDLGANGDGEAVVAEHLGCHPGGEVGCVVEEAAPLPLAVHAQ